MKKNIPTYFLAFVFVLAPVIMAQDSMWIKPDDIRYTYKSDTSYYRLIFYLENGYVKAEPGYIIESGIGSENLVGYFLYEPKVKVILKSGKEIKKEDYLYRFEN